MTVLAPPAAPFEIKIFNFPLKIKCPPEEMEELQLAVKHVDKLLNQLKKTYPHAPIDQLAILAALNMHQDLVKLQHQTAKEKSQLEEQLAKINQQLDECILKMEASS